MDLWTNMSSFKEALLLFTFSLILKQGSSQINGLRCTANGGVRGVCKSLYDCSAALGYLRANVTLPSCNANNNNLYCCPIERRISATKCENFKTVLKRSSSVVPLLPIAILEYDQPSSEIICDTNRNPLISGGRDASIDEMPFMVALGYNVSHVPWRCGGTLISEDFVLTAAHCVVNPYAGPPNKLLLGDITLSQATSRSREIIGVSKIIVHPKYQPPLTYHDIALVKMSRKINITKSIMPACLPQAEDDLLRRVDKKKFTASGFGITGVGEPQSDTLQVVNLNGYSFELCRSFYREIPTARIKFPDGITRTQICAGDGVGHKDTCQGDSGGPLLMADKDKPCIFYVTGITSFGPNQCGEKAPAVYTNVLSYLDWIEQEVWLKRHY